MTKHALWIAIFLGGITALLWRTSRPSGWRAASQKAVNVGFQTGQTAPDFELRALDGSMLRLSGLRGAPVLLNFWATWCAPCRVEMPWLVDLDRQYRAQGVQIIGVSLDDPGARAEVAKFTMERSVRYPVLLGNASVADAYGGVRFLPQSFFIDQEGKIKASRVGMPDRAQLEKGIQELLGHRLQSRVIGR
jgi:peroxiredoxin